MVAAGVPLLLVFWYSAACYASESGGSPVASGDTALEWNALAGVLAEENAPKGRPRLGGSSDAPALPTYLRVAASDDHQWRFRPETGARQMTSAVRDILLATPPPPTPEPPRSPFESLCHLDRIYVRVQRNIFNTETAFQHLTLGSCAVNEVTQDHYYFLYLLTSSCGFSTQSLADFFVVSNTIYFAPKTDLDVVWDVPFAVAVQCQYHRTHHVYSAGFHPNLNGGTVFKTLSSAAKALIILQDVLGNELTGPQTYALGQPMYFEAKLIDGLSAGTRLYVNKCYMTASQDSNSSSKHLSIDNHGCLQDSKTSIHANFIVQSSKTSLKFSLGALLFTDMLGTPGTPKKIYMHCEISAGPLTATASHKSCTYDPASMTWTELYDDNAVCACCDTFCMDLPKASKVLLTSSSLEVDNSSVEWLL